MEPSSDQILQKAIAAHKAGKFQDAEGLYKAILQSQPLHPDANHNLGVLAVSVDKVNESLPLFKAAIEANPKIEQFWLSYIDALIKTEMLEKAMWVLKLAKRSGLGGDKLKALERQLLLQSKSTDPVGPPKQQLRSLLDHYQRGRFSEAEKLAIDLTKSFPKHAFAWKILGTLFKQTKDYSKALEASEMAVSLSPLDAEAHSNLANLLKERRKLEDAVASYKRAIDLQVGSAGVYYNLGNTLKEIGNLKDAAKVYRQAATLKPDYAEAYTNLGITFQGLGILNEAEEIYTKVIYLKPYYPAAFYNLGFIYKQQSKLALSIDCLKAAIKYNPDFVEARTLINDVSNSAVPSWHFPMMNDKQRNEAYFSAIKLAVDEGDFVLEIGTGSGLLSLMASSCGAKNVITCETSTMLSKTAEEIIKGNGYKDKIRVLNKKSTDLIVGKDLPQKPDLIISEVLSAEFLGEGVLATITDANDRLLKNEGKIIPQGGSIKVALIGSSQEVINATAVGKVHGFDLSKFNAIAQRKFSLKLENKPVFVSCPQEAFNFDLRARNVMEKEEKTIKLRAIRDGVCIGLIQWLWIHLYKDIEYENKPGEVYSHWPTPIYLFEEPVSLKKGEIVEIRALRGSDSVWFYQQSSV